MPDRIGTKAETSLAQQPAPQWGQTTIYPLVLADMRQQHQRHPALFSWSDYQILEADLLTRVQAGLAHYGMPLMTFNGRCAGEDALDEAEDLTLYLRQEVEEGDADAWPLYDAALRLLVRLAVHVQRKNLDAPILAD